MGDTLYSWVEVLFLKKLFSSKLIYKLTQLQLPEILVSARVYRGKKNLNQVLWRTPIIPVPQGAKGEGLYVRTLHFKSKNLKNKQPKHLI